MALGVHVDNFFSVTSLVYFLIYLETHANTKSNRTISLDICFLNSYHHAPSKNDCKVQFCTGKFIRKLQQQILMSLHCYSLEHCAGGWSEILLSDD